MPHQAAELTTAMARTRFDAIIVDYGFFGIVPFLLGCWLATGIYDAFAPDGVTSFELMQQASH